MTVFQGYIVRPCLKKKRNSICVYEMPSVAWQEDADCTEHTAVTRGPNSNAGGIRSGRDMHHEQGHTVAQPLGETVGQYLNETHSVFW